MKNILLISAFSLLLLNGCAHQIERESPTSSTPNHVFNKNYTIGVVKTVSVGEPLIQVKDYYVTKYSLPQMSPSERFTVDGTMVHEIFDVGQKFDVHGKITMDGEEFTIVPFTPNPVHFKALLVKKDGTIHNKIGNYNAQLGGIIPMIYTYQITPESAKLNRIEDEKVVTDKGYQNYEILYNGSNKSSMLFTYREFSPDGLARTAFYQNLTYEANATSIRFKGFKINILKSNNEEIKFFVAEDSL